MILTAEKRNPEFTATLATIARPCLQKNTTEKERLHFVIPAFETQGQDYEEFKANLSTIASSELLRGT